MSHSVREAYSLYRQPINSGRVQGLDPSHMTRMQYCLECLGFIVNTSAESSDSRILVLSVDSIAMEIRFSSNQNQANLKEARRKARKETSLSPHAGTATGQNECVLLPGLQEELEWLTCAGGMAKH